MIKKNLILSLFVFFTFLFVFPVRADYNQPVFSEAIEENLKSGGTSNEAFVPNSLSAFIQSWFCALSGAGRKSDCPEGEGGPQANAQGSVLGQVNSSIATLYHYPPADTQQYIAYYKDRIGIAERAYAQGIGFSGLLPTLTLWKGFRNIAYGFLIIIMVAIGFMILFRWKIDPRTVVSVQNAIPRLIITLILITFSYAIVGLLIDLMYLVIFVAFFALGKANPEILQNFSGGAFTTLIGTVFRTGFGAIEDIVNFLGLGLDKGALSKLINAILPGFTGSPLAPFIDSPLAALSTAIVGLLVILSLVIMMVRIFFMLLSAWINVLLSLIFGPLQLMFGAIPGVDSFSGWFKSLVANLAVFPITILLLLVGSILTGTQDGTLWTPPGLGGTTGRGVAGLLGLGVVMVIPTVVNGFKEAIKAKQVIPAGPGAIFSPFGTTAGGLMQVGQMSYYFGGPIKGIMNRIRNTGK